MEFVEFEEYQFTCDTCGFPLIFRQLKTDHSQQFLEPHYTCENPRATITVTNPRKFGVWTAITGDSA